MATTLRSCLCNLFFFGSLQTALSLFWPVDMDMDKVIREDMAQAVQIWRKQESKEHFLKSIKMQNLKETMLIIIILHLYNLSIMVDESVYKIKIYRNVKYKYIH